MRHRLKTEPALLVTSEPRRSKESPDWVVGTADAFRGKIKPGRRVSWERVEYLHDAIIRPRVMTSCAQRRAQQKEALWNEVKRRRRFTCSSALLELFQEEENQPCACLAVDESPISRTLGVGILNKVELFENTRYVTLDLWSVASVTVYRWLFCHDGWRKPGADWPSGPPRTGPLGWNFVYLCARPQNLSDRPVVASRRHIPLVYTAVSHWRSVNHC